jgi:TonB family protein
LWVFLAASLLAGATQTAIAADGEPELEAPGATGSYLRSLHARVHSRWSGNFLKMASAQLPKTHPLNAPELRVVLEATLARDGALVDTHVSAPSGVAELDAAALEVLKESAPMPAAPAELISDDDQVHLTWAFARDRRACSEVKVVQKEGPLEEALPRLLAAKREAEALRRIAAAPAPERSLSLFAATWLKRALPDPKLARAAAIGLLGAGDASGEKLAREALGQEDAAAAAAAALAHAKRSLCPLVKDNLARTGTRPQMAALLALRAAPDAACLPELIAVAHNRSLLVPSRVAALEALGPIADAPARKAVVELEKDPLPAVRAAAVLALAQPGGGKAALFRLTPLLRDPAVEVRAAAIAGVLRVAGDSALDQLYLLGKETDPRPYEAAAAGLSRLASDASAQLLLRIYLRKDKVTRTAAAAALAARSDEFARAALDAVKDDPAPEIRVFASALLEPAERRATAHAAQGPQLYRALLGAADRSGAAAWLVDRFPSSPPPVQAELLSAWLVAGPALGVTAVTNR